MSAQAAIRPRADTAPGTAREIIHELARRHGICYERAGYDDWAEAVSRVAGDDVELDETEWLLVALRRADVVPSIEGTRLHYRYMQERKAHVA